MSSRGVEAPANIDVAHALKESAVAGLIAFGLFLPLIGFHAVQDIRNELVLETRWGLLFAFVSLVAAGRLFVNLVITPWRERRRGKAPRATAAPWPPRLPFVVCSLAPRSPQSSSSSSIRRLPYGLQALAAR